MRIVKVGLTDYLCRYYNGQTTYCHKFIDKNYHLWTIQDAKDGVKMKDAGYEWDADKKELKQVIDYPDKFPKDNWELIHEFVNKFGRIPKDEDELNVLIEYVLLERQRVASWSEKDEKYLNDAIDACKAQYGNMSYTADWLKFLKEKIQLRPKYEWSEEDEKKLDNTIIQLQAASNIIVNDEVDDSIAFIKSLKDRVQPQPKQEWSEEDKMQLDAAIHLVSSTGHIETTNWLKSIKDRVFQQNITVTDEELAKAKKDAYNDALDKIEYHSGEPTFDDGWSAAIWYLKKKNARPQSTWKPSEEQMGALWDSIKHNLHLHPVLESLYQDLKKLKE